MIDWKLIEELEGSRLQGYVPLPETSQSGVTVGCGVDLGQISAGELARLSPALRAKLQPFVGLRKLAAVTQLQRLRGLTLSAAEAAELDQVVEGADLAALKASYNAVSKTSFDELPDAVQTVAASVEFQYGNLQRRCPKLWSALTSQNFRLMVEELRHFGDQYETRRRREAAYLETRLGAEKPHGTKL